MPTYTLRCNKCGDIQEQLLKITEYDEQTLKDKPCLVVGCDGTYEHTFENTNIAHNWPDGKPTPRFGR